MTASNGSLPYQFEIVPFKYMMVDAYQRPLTTFVDKIAENFDPALVGIIAVSRRSKTQHAVMDGQTRVEGMKRVGLEDGPCLVYLGLTRAQEADLFAKFQTQRRGMHSVDRFKAEVIAERPHAVAINDLLHREGFELGTNIQQAPNLIAAAASLEYAYFGASKGAKEPNPELLVKTLRAIQAAWPTLPDTSRGTLMIRGMAHYLATHPDTDPERLADRLSRVQPSTLAKRAEALREGKGMTSKSPAFMAEAIDNMYSKRS